MYALNNDERTSEGCSCIQPTGFYVGPSRRSPSLRKAVRISVRKELLDPASGIFGWALHHVGLCPMKTSRWGIPTLLQDLHWLRLSDSFKPAASRELNRCAMSLTSGMAFTMNHLSPRAVRSVPCFTRPQTRRRVEPQETPNHGCYTLWRTQRHTHTLPAAFSVQQPGPESCSEVG